MRRNDCRQGPGGDDTDPAAIRDADRMATEFSAAGVKEIYLVVNRFRTDFLQKQLISSALEIAEELGLTLLGTVPEDEAVGAATSCGVPVVIRQADSPAARIFAAMARRMPGKELIVDYDGSVDFFVI